MPVYKIADLLIGINPKTEYTKFRLKDYICGDGTYPDFTVEVTQQMIDYEAETVPGLSVAVYESSAIYRQICLKILESYDGIFFHGSSLAAHNKAYIFTAPSGVGKSTHTRMWREIFGDKVTMINDDKPIIRNIGGTYFVYGTPWTGKHELGNNIKVPLDGICFLNRGKDNFIEKINGLDNLSKALIQTILPRDKELMNKLINFLEKMLSEVNTYKMECNISHKAAEVAYNYMRGEY